MQWIYIDAIAFLTVAVIAGFIIPQILLIAFRKNLFDEVDPRKIHKGTVPRLGGIAFFPAILLAILLLMGISLMFGSDDLKLTFYYEMASLCFVVCAIVTLYLVGMADDLVGVKYRAKFVAQILSAVFIIIGGINLSNLHGFLGISHLPWMISVLFTVVLTVFITNSINLIDGIDGLASGLSAVACLFYGWVCYKYGLYVYSMLAFATMGALCPFFYYNVFGNVNKQKKIFMGDTGALTIGLILSVLSIRICNVDKPEIQENLGVVAFAPLLIPCLDVVRVYFRRIRHHKSPFMPDKTHIHHKLLALGMSQKTAMPTIIISSLILIVMNFYLSKYLNITLLFALDMLLWISAMYWITIKAKKLSV